MRSTRGSARGNAGPVPVSRGVMVQLTIAYVALGLGVVLLLGGALSLLNRRSSAMLTRYQRLLVLGALSGLVAFGAAAVLLLRSSLWLP